MMAEHTSVSDAQRDARMTFLGGFPGQLASGPLWLISAALTTWVSPRYGIVALVVGGMFIFPLGQLLLRAMGRRPSLQPGNPMKDLAMQSAFSIPALLPLVGAATLHRLEWFYPAMMLVVGAHYFPFAFLYGMRMFLVLGGILCATAVFAGTNAAFGQLAGWFTGVVLMIFAFIGRRLIVAPPPARISHAA
jgi:hypothetical protein